MTWEVQVFETSLGRPSTIIPNSVEIGAIVWNVYRTNRQTHIHIYYISCIYIQCRPLIAITA
jgi:hypothetical protein